MLTIKDIICDHEEFFKIKLFEATMSVCADSSSWVKVRSNLASKYKFTLDLDTFASAMGDRCLVYPTGSILFSKKTSVLEVFVRYDFEHEQNAAVCAMLVHGLTDKNRKEPNPSLTTPYISHRFASFMPPELLGVIKIIFPKEYTIAQIEDIITKWKYVANNVSQAKLSYDSYHSFLETL